MNSAAPTLRTSRLELVASTVELARDELRNPDRLFEKLAVVPCAAWPPENTRDVLALFLETFERGGTAMDGWLSWYWIRTDRRVRALVGGGGFMGLPDDCGTVEIGYETLPAERLQGVATEAVGALTRWALEQAGVAAVEAETTVENVGSIRVLEKNGFLRLSGESEPRAVRYRRAGGASALPG